MNTSTIQTALVTAAFSATVAAVILGATLNHGVNGPDARAADSRSLGAKGDRLPRLASPKADYMTVETRGDRVSVLSKVPVENSD